MKKKVLNIFCVFIFLISIFSYSVKTQAATPTSKVNMIVTSGCYTYKKMNSSKAYRTDYLTFGEEVYVISISGNYAKINNDGKIQYVLTKFLDYKKYTVEKMEVMVGPKASTSTSKNTLGYVFYGQDVNFLNEYKNSSGVVYVKCLIDKTYTSDGKSIKNENVVGYIKKSNLEIKSTPKVINQTTKLYNYAFNSNSDSSMKKSAGTIYMGQQIELLMKGSTWSKILYNNKEYFVYTNKLDDFKLQGMVKTLSHREKPSSSSKLLNYIYWNSTITVLDTYVNSSNVKYYYCKVNGKYGFIRDHLNDVQYVGYQTKMITNRNVNLYQKTSSDSKVLNTVDTKELVTVLYSGDTWTYVSYEGTKGYIYSKNLDYVSQKANGNYYTSAYRLYKNNSNGSLNDQVSVLVTNEKNNYAYIQTSENKKYWMKYDSLIQNKKMIRYTINPQTTLYVGKVKSNETIKVPYMTKVEYIGIAHSYTSGKWIKVKYDNKSCFMWMEAGEEYLTSTKSSFKYSSSNSFQKDLIELALEVNKLNTKYEHGQSEGIVDTDGKYGFDCSGFAAYLLNTTMNKYVPVYSLSKDINVLFETTNIYNKGLNGEFNATTILNHELNIDVLQPGDVIYFNLKENASNEVDYDHCGIYLGNGEFIHSSYSWNKVIIMPLKDIYEDSIVKVIRYLPKTVKPANSIAYATSYSTPIYEEKNSSSNKIMIPAESQVQILYKSNNWSYVKYDSDKYGYALNKYLTNELENHNEVRYVIVDTLKLYESRATSGNYIKINKGDKVVYIRQYPSTNYYLVNYNNLNYYVYAKNGLDSVLVP